MRKIVSVLMVLLLVLMPMETLLVDAASVGNLTFSVANGQATVFACKTSAVGKITVPATYKGKPVTAIENDAFSGCKKLTSISLPTSLRTIGDCAFTLCTGLKRITIPAKVTTIGYRAFEYCSSLSTIKVAKGNTAYYASGNCLIDKAKKEVIAGTNNSVIPGGGKVRGIGDYAFSGRTKLTDVVIPEGVLYVGSYSYAGCSNLWSFTFPQSLSNCSYNYERINAIGEGIFADCPKLTRMRYAGSRSQWESQNYFGWSGWPAWAKQQVVCADDYSYSVTAKNTSSGIAVEWERTNYSDEYKLLRRTYQNGAWTGWKRILMTFGGSYTDKAVKAGGIYQYTVEPVTVTPATGYITTPSVRRLKASSSVKLAKASKGFKVTWSKVVGAKKYEVYRRTGSGSWKKVKTTTGRSYTDKTAKKGKYYTYRVRAVNGSSKSVFKTGKKTKR